MPILVKEQPPDPENLVTALRRMSQQMETEAAESRDDGEHDDAVRAEGASGAFLWAANMAERALRDSYNAGALAGMRLHKEHRDDS